METLSQRRQRATRDWDTTGNYYRNLNTHFDQQQQQQQHHHHQSRQQQQNQQSRNYASGCSVNSQQQDDANDQDDNNNRTTDSQTMMHILKANIGTGVLAMPMAFGHVGLWFGLALVPIIGAICIHCMNILIESHNRICDRFNYESLDYDQVAALSLACGPKPARRLAKWASVFVSTFLMLTQIGFCCVYTLFAVENIQLAMFNLFNLDYSTTTYLLIVFPIIGLASCTSNLKHLARISTLANVLQLTGLALIFYDLFLFNTYSQQLLDTSQADEQLLASSLSTTIVSMANESSTADTTAAATPTPDSTYKPNIRVEQGISANLAAGLPLFFATAVYAFEGIGVVLPLVKEMQYPSRISGRHGVLNTSMSLVALLYMAMGFFGYAKYGQHVAGSITLNLPETTLNELVRLTFAIAIGLSYSLQFYVPWTIVWPLIDESLFYSYRPRVARDKLDILNKLSAENEWALNEAFEQEQRELEQQQLREQRTNLINIGDSLITSSQDQRDHESNASTFASSYSCSVASGVPQQTFGKSAASHRFHLSSSLAGSCHYGTIQEHQQQQPTATKTTTMMTPTGVQIRAGAMTKRLRNRLEEVMEQESDEDSMPEVQWRPPPRSMRGKRKLVRYTVILLSVSFTFVAAALIPRLDLFISLIGALASSCLAIIFPATIQLCAFWNLDMDDDNRETDDDQDNDRDGQQVGQKSTKAQQQKEADDELCFGPTRTKGRLINWRQKRRQVMWFLFVLKNLFLVLFGFLGLITGSWISLSQLGFPGIT